MSRPKNLTTDEAEIWQRMEQHGEELVRDKALPLAQWQKLHDEYYERTKR